MCPGAVRTPIACCFRSLWELPPFGTSLCPGLYSQTPPEVTHRDLPMEVQKESRGMRERVLET